MTAIEDHDDVLIYRGPSQRSNLLASARSDFFQRFGQQTASSETDRSECCKREGASGIARRGSRYGAADHRHAPEIRTIPPRGRFARHSWHQPEETRRNAALPNSFRAVTAFRAES